MLLLLLWFTKKNFYKLHSSFSKFNFKSCVDLLFIRLYLSSIYRITFPKPSTSSTSRKRKAEEELPSPVEKVVSVEPYVIPNRGPYPYNQPKM